MKDSCDLIPVLSVMYLNIANVHKHISQRFSFDPVWLNLCTDFIWQQSQVYKSCTILQSRRQRHSPVFLPDSVSLQQLFALSLFLPQVFTACASAACCCCCAQGSGLLLGICLSCCCRWPCVQLPCPSCSLSTSTPAPSGLLLTLSLWGATLVSAKGSLWNEGVTGNALFKRSYCWSAARL